MRAELHFVTHGEGREVERAESEEETYVVQGDKVIITTFNVDLIEHVRGFSHDARLDCLGAARDEKTDRGNSRYIGKTETRR